MKPTSISSNLNDFKQPTRSSGVKQNARLIAKAVFFAGAIQTCLVSDNQLSPPKSLTPQLESLFSGSLPNTSLEKVLSPEERRKNLGAQISELVEIYAVEPGDTPDGLAAKSGLSREEFLTLNSFLGYEFPKILRPGDSFVSPKDSEQVRGYLDILKKVNHSELLRDAVEAGKSVKELKKIVQVSPFPSEVECVGLTEMYNAMITQQETELDPGLISIVDPRIQGVPSCANSIKYGWMYACNLKHYDKKQQAMLLTEGLDAWLLPKRLYKDFGYTQHFRELMDDFDFANITAQDPIRPDKKEEYHTKVRRLFFEMKESKLPGLTLVPLFFKYSHSKGKVANAYAGVPLKDKHMNTHQTIFGRNATMVFSASDIPTIEAGKRIPFGKESPHRKNLEKKLDTQNMWVYRFREELLSALSEEKNPLLFKDSTPERARYRDLFRKAIESGTLANTKLEAFGTTISKNSVILRLYSRYMTAVWKMNLTKEELSWYVKPIKPIAEKRSVVDILANFIINRADFNGSFSQDFKNKVLEGIKTYPEFFDIKINGKSIDVAAELVHIGEGKGIDIVPTDTISLSGPMMIDGEIQSTHPDPERQKVMNRRTRFAFEFFASAYLPTEAAVPTKRAIKNRDTISTPAAGLRYFKMYALRKGETIEQVLFDSIIEFEQIDPRDPKWQDKIFWHYQYQIRGLMLDGFLRSESELNPSATLPNRPIPYYDRASVTATWPKHIKTYYESKKMEQEALDSDILEFPIIGGGGITTPKELFIRLSERIASSEGQYPILRQIQSFDEFQKLYFIDQAYRRARKDALSENVFAFFRKAEHNRTLFFSVSDIAKLVKEITSLSPLKVPVLKPHDDEAIDSIVPNAQIAALIKNTLFIETYGGGFLKWRQSVKWMRGKRSNSVGIYQIRFEDLAHADIHKWVLRTYRKYGPEPLSQPTRQDILDAISYTLSPEVLERGKKFFAGDVSGINAFYEDTLKIARIRTIFSKTEASREEIFEAYDLLREVSRMDIMWEKPFLGNYLNTELLNSKYHKHAEKVIFWLQKIGIPLEDLVENEELRFQYARTLIFVNNQSEEPTLYMYATNYFLRVMEGIKVPVETKDIYLVPNSLYGEIKQAIAGQISFGKNRYLEHLDFYIRQLERRLQAERYLKKMGDTSIPDDRILLLEKAQRIFRGYLFGMQKNPEKINSITLEIFANPELQEILQDRQLPVYPFVTDIEIQSRDPFRASAFHYISKVMKAVDSKNTPQTGVLQNFYNEQIKKIIPAGFQR